MVAGFGTLRPALPVSADAGHWGVPGVAIGHAVGHVVGSNIFTVLGILGATAMIARVPVEGQFLSFDPEVMLAVSAALAAILWRGGRIGRAAGARLLAASAVHLWATA